VRTGRGAGSAITRALVFGVTVVAAVSLLSTADASAAPPRAAWHACGSTAGEQCTSVRVPLDYARAAGSIALAVARLPSTGSPQGDLFVNPGGPGESGVEILPIVAALLPGAVREHFNVVSFDERGTGASDRLSCGPLPSVVAALDPAPADPGRALPGTATYRALAADCARRYPDLLRSVNTTNAARDMDRIRRALGDDRLNYYGLSYGTVLGAAYVTLFPQRVRAMVLDGAVDPTEPLAEQAVAEGPALAASLDHFLATCGASPTCPLGPDPRAAYDNLYRSLAVHPLEAGGRPVTAGDLLTATLFYLSVPTFTPGFPAALGAAARGDGAPLASLAVSFAEDLDGSSLVAPEWAITCQDAPSHPGPVAAGALARTLSRADAPAGAEAVTNTLAGCVAWPAARRPITTVHGPTGLPPVVIGTTGDPNTPYSSARRLVRTLGRARLLTWVGQGHTWLLNGSTDACMTAFVSAYLVDGTLPPRAGTCPAARRR